MMKKVIVLAMMLMLTGCAPAEGREEGHSSMMVTANGEEEAISRFLNRDRKELEFDMFCMLE